MSDHERGAYAPPIDPPLSFDPRRPVRGARPLPFTVIISLLVLAALAAVIFLFYRSGVREAGQAPQVVGTPVGAMKSPAPAETQPTDPAAGLQIYRAGDGGAPVEPQFTAPPEQPQPRAPTTAVVLPPAAIRPAIPATSVAVAKPATPAPKALAKVVPPPPAKPVPKAEPIVVTPKVASGGAAVQIGAVSSTDLAQRAWTDAVSVAPGLAAGKGKAVERIEKNGGILYRTAVTGFASRADAQAFCAKLQAAGKSCFVR